LFGFPVPPAFVTLLNTLYYDCGSAEADFESVDDENYQNYFAGVVEDIRGFIDGKPVRVMTN